MKKSLINLLLSLILITASCTKEELFKDNTRVNLWLKHNGAEMPVVVDGNTNSKIFILLLHGGPGGSAQTFNNYLTPFSDLLEEDYAMVYWDQRNSGISRGEWDPSKITIAQHIEDLDQVIELLKFKFGNDIIIFLGGHSWGAYLSEVYLLDTVLQNKVRGWINIDGLNNRNQNNKDALKRIQEVAMEQIALNKETASWTIMLDDVQIEMNKNIQNYDINTENIVFSLIRRAELIIDRSNLVVLNVGSSFASNFRSNVHPIIFSTNSRTLNLLIPQIFDFDNSVDQGLININIPCLFLYGNYDVRTPYFQANYVMNRISTDPEDKKLVLFQQSEHSSPANEPVALAEEIKMFVEKYK